MRQASQLGLITLTALIWSCGPAAAQPQARSDGNLVRVVATVTDRDNHLVSNLVPADFEIEDDGKRQTLTSFDAAVRPVTVTVIVDRSDSMSLGPDGVRAAAERFVTGLLPGDQARICAFAKLRRVLSWVHNRSRRACPRRASLQDRIRQSAVRRIASGIEAMTVVPADRRRVLLVFSDGEDSGSRTTLRAVIERARALDVMVYGIGLQTRYYDGDDFVDSRPERTLMSSQRNGRRLLRAGQGQ